MSGDSVTAMYDALKKVERLLAFDLSRMIAFGPDYNQAVRDVYDEVVAVRRKTNDRHERSY